MRFFELIATVFDNLGRRKGRVAMTAIGVVIGTAAVVLLVSLAVGLQRNATQQLYGISDLSKIDVSPGYSEVPLELAGSTWGGGGYAQGVTPPNITPITPDSLAQFAAIPGVAHVIPTDWSQVGMIFRVGRMESWVSVTGVGTDDLNNLGFQAQAGTLQLERGTVVVGYTVPNSFYDPTLRPGQEPPPPPDLLDARLRVTLIKWSETGEEVRRDIPLRVVGVLVETRDTPDWTVYMRLEELEGYNEWALNHQIDRYRDGYPSTIVRAVSPREVLDIAETIKEMGYQAFAAQETVQNVNNFFLILQVIFGGVGAIALLVAAIGIANTMAMAILERTREIGLMKAIGATNRDVLSIFLGESAGIGLIGGIGGVALGWSSGQLINVFALSYLAERAAETGGLPPTVAVYTPPWLPVFALVFASLIGLISGLYPSLRAATLIPVIALKNE
jgi:putative ABC transport system permease protein